MNLSAGKNLKYINPMSCQRRKTQIHNMIRHKAQDSVSNDTRAFESTILQFSLGNMLFLNSLSGGCPFLCPRVAVWRKRPSIALPRKITTFQLFLLITEDDEGNKKMISIIVHPYQPKTKKSQLFEVFGNQAQID